MPLSIKRSPGETIITDRPMIITIESVDDDGSITFTLEGNNAAQPSITEQAQIGILPAIGPTARHPVPSPEQKEVARLGQLIGESRSNKLVGQRPNGEQVVISLDALQARSLPSDIEWLPETPLDKETDEKRHARQVANSTAGPGSGSPEGRGPT